MRWIVIGLTVLWLGTAWGRCEDGPPPLRLQGQGQLCLLGFCLYDARLWTAQPGFSYDAPFALDILYRRSIPRTRMIDTAIDEIRRLSDPPPPEATLERWRTAMAPAFIDTRPGDSICGVYLPGRGVRFYVNGITSAEIDDPAFARAFFDIWLAPSTRAASLRERLLGKK